MRTLHVDTGREMRGGQWQVLYLLEQMENATLLAPRDSPLFAAAREKGVDVQPLTLGALLKKARRVDLVHVHGAHAHTLAALTGAKPLVVSRRVGFPAKRGLASRWKYAKGTMFLAVSQFVAGQLKAAGVPEAKVRVVYDGVPTPFEGRRTSPPPTREGRVGGVLARLALGATVPGRVIALASKPIQIPGVTVDHITDLWAGLSSASVFVYKSEMEGLGSAALAAQAAGVPVVASRVGGLPEAVLHGETGFIVEDGDFATPVKRLLDDPALAQKMGRAARERAQREFSVEVMVKKTMNAYEDILA